MDKVITTTMLIVIGMVMSILLFNTAYPAIAQSGDALTNMTYRADDRMKSQIEIVHAAAELDSSGWWQDINGNGEFDTFIWVKNIGSTRITPIEGLDVFFGPEGEFVRIPHQSSAGGLHPYWTADVENASDWTPTATVKITVHYAFPLPTDQYYIKVTAPNGVSTEQLMGM